MAYDSDRVECAADWLHTIGIVCHSQPFIAHIMKADQSRARESTARRVHRFPLHADRQISRFGRLSALNWAAVSEGGAKSGMRQVDEVIMGASCGLAWAVRPPAALKAGLPDTIAALTVNKVCGSGLKAVMLAAQAIRAGDADVILAGGMESMSQAPHLLFNTRNGWKIGDQKAVDAMIHDGLWCAFENWHMGEAAEHIATKCGIGRPEQDRFAAQSQQRAAQAWAQGAFAAEVLRSRREPTRAKTLDRRGLSRTTTETMAKLKPAFKGDGASRRAMRRCCRGRRGISRAVVTQS